MYDEQVLYVSDEGYARLVAHPSQRKLVLEHMVVEEPFDLHTARHWDTTNPSYWVFYDELTGVEFTHDGIAVAHAKDHWGVELTGEEN